MNIKRLLYSGSKWLRKHSPEVFTGFALAGLGLTIVELDRVSPEAHRQLDMARDELEDIQEEILDPEARKVQEKAIKKTCALELLKLYSRPGAAAITTGFCIIMSNHISRQRNAALVSFASMSQAALMDYQHHVHNIVGDEKAARIQNAVDAEKVSEQIAEGDIQNTGLGTDRILESITGQVFYSDIHIVHNSWIGIENRLKKGDDIDLNDWLSELHIELSEVGESMYWEYDPEHNKDIPTLNTIPVYSKDGLLCHKLVYSRKPDWYA